MTANQKLYNHPYYWGAFTIAGKLITKVKSDDLQDFYALLLDETEIETGNARRLG